MNPGTLETPRYASLRKGGKVLGRLALWVQLGFLIMGMGLFLDQARDLLSDAHFTWGERRVMGVIALVTLGGCGLAGWILGQLFRIFAQVLDVLADGAEAAWRTGDLIEQHLVPTLGLIALALEERDGSAGLRPALASLGDPPTTLRLSLVQFRLEGIDTGWRITSARRVLPGAGNETPSDRQLESPGSAAPPGIPPTAEPSLRRSLGDPANPPDTR